MLTLSSTALKRGLDTLLHHKYSDFFPLPPELCAVTNGWDKLSEHLQSIDLSRYRPKRPMFSYAPKSRVNLRPVTLLHPIDAILYFSLVRDVRDEIEDQRIPEDRNRVFSFRAEFAEVDELYSAVPSHNEFQEQQSYKAALVPNGFIATADIADFYPRLYQHRVRNALESCVSNAKQKHPQVLERMLRRMSFDRTSFGIPIGPAASRPLAEAALIDIDEALLSLEIDFIRYIDDFYIFAGTRDEAEWGLRKLGEILSENHGLSLQSAKTKIQSSAQFLADLQDVAGTESAVDAAFDEIVDAHFYDIETLDDLTESQKDLLSALDLGEILEKPLDEEEINYKKVAFILDKLSSLERPDLIPIVLDNLTRLYPVAHAINAFFRDFGSLDAAIRNDAAERLLAPIEAVGKAQAPEFYAIWILDIFKSVPVWNHRSIILRIFRQTHSQSIKRYAALALASVGGRAEALALKEAIHAAEPLTRTAIILASKKLGADERRYWLQEIGLDLFEELIVEHC